VTLRARPPTEANAARGAIEDDRDHLHPAEPAAKEHRARAELTQHERDHLISDLLVEYSVKDGKGKLSLRATKAAPAMFRVTVSERHVQRIWKKALESRAETGVFKAKSGRKGNCGRKVIYDRDEVKAAVASLPPEKRKTVKSISEALRISECTINRLLKQK
jgi:hypothetical protein